MKETYIHGIKVSYEDNAQGGVYYLQQDLDAEEAKVFFNQARSTGYAKFENDGGSNYTLHNNSGTYTITCR